MEGKIDLELSGDAPLFRHIKSQSDLFVEVFHRLVAEFPQSTLVEFHPQSKGSKVSKGYRLENCPYEVLDLIRDFDPTEGFNIRILKWWGFGLYFFVQVGSKKFHLISKVSHDLTGYLVSVSPDPWDYLHVIESNKKLDEELSLGNISQGQLIQIFKKIEESEDPDVLLKGLKREILLIIGNRN